MKCNGVEGRMLKREKIGVRLADVSWRWKKAEGKKGGRENRKEAGLWERGRRCGVDVDGVVERMMERLKQRAETYCKRERRLCTCARGREKEHKRLKKGMLGRERWVAEDAERNWKIEAPREKIKRVRRGNSKEGGRRRGKGCKAECYIERWSC